MMEIYHTYDTGPSIDFLLERDGEYVDPELATTIQAKIRINGEEYLKLTINESGNLFVVEDEDGYNRIRLVFGPDYLNEEGIYQVQLRLTWTDGTETSPLPYEFRVIPKWEVAP